MVPELWTKGDTTQPWNADLSAKSMLYTPGLSLDAVGLAVRIHVMMTGANAGALMKVQESARNMTKIITNCSH